LLASLEIDKASNFFHSAKLAISGTIALVQSCSIYDLVYYVYNEVIYVALCAKVSRNACDKKKELYWFNRINVISIFLQSAISRTHWYAISAYWI